MGSMAHHIYQHHGSYGFCGVKSGALSKIQQFSFDDIPNQNFPGFPIAMFDYWRVTKATVHIIISYLPNPVLIRCKLPWDKNEQKDVENSPMGRAYEHHQLSTAIARNTTYKSASHPICGITTSYINYRKKPVITSYDCYFGPLLVLQECVFPSPSGDARVRVRRCWEPRFWRCGSRVIAELTW